MNSRCVDRAWLLQLLSDVQVALQRLGLEGAGRTAEIEHFLGGPPMLLITGPVRSGKSVVAEALRDLVPSLELEKRIVEGCSPRSLADAVVAVTPATAALSMAELELLAGLHKLRRPAFVVVSGVNLLGEDGAARRVARQEIEQHRLRPRLEPLDVRWWFLSEDQPPGDLREALRFLLGLTDGRAHLRPALDLLSQVLEESVAEMTDRVRQRDEERAAFAGLEARVPPVLSHLKEAAHIARLRLRDAIREAQYALDQSVEPLAGGLAGWAARGGQGEVTEVLAPFEDARIKFIADLQAALDDGPATFEAEVVRVTGGATALAEEIGVQVRQHLIETEPWFSPSTLEALEAIKGTQLTTVIEEVESEVRKELQAPKSRAEKARRAVDQIWQGGRTPLDERLRTRLSAGLEALLEPRLQQLLERGSREVADAASRSASRRGAVLEQQVKELRAALNRRHDWSDAYRDLIDCTDTVKEARRARDL